MTCRCATPAEHRNRSDDRDRDTEIAREREQAKVAKIDREQAAAIAKSQAVAAARAATPNPDDYSIEIIQRIRRHLVLQVRYPSCKACAFEGLKTLVILNVNELEALRWRRIDPHFRLRTTDHATAHPKDAPSPAARFPGTADGWLDAVAYAKGKP